MLVRDLAGSDNDLPNSGSSRLTAIPTYHVHAT